jgi:hypothetical protein
MTGGEVGAQQPSPPPPPPPPRGAAPYVATLSPLGLKGLTFKMIAVLATYSSFGFLFGCVSAECLLNVC